MLKNVIKYDIKLIKEMNALSSLPLDIFLNDKPVRLAIMA